MGLPHRGSRARPPPHPDPLRRDRGLDGSRGNRPLRLFRDAAGCDLRGRHPESLGHREPEPLRPRRHPCRRRQPHPYQPRHHGQTSKLRAQHRPGQWRRKHRPCSLDRSHRPHRQPLIQRRPMSVEQPWLHPLPLHKVERRHAAAYLAEIATSNGPIAANRARAALSALFTWAMREGLVDTNPVVGTNRAVPERSRERVLSDEGLAAIWEACGADDYGRIVRLLILTGQRREEVGGMRWAEIDLASARWCLPPERTMNHRPHEIPLPAPALKIIRCLSRRPDRPYLFGEGQGPFQGWSKARTGLDRRAAAAGHPLAPWRLHDIRRTVATRLAELGVQPHVIVAVLNHVSGHKAGVAGIYNRALYAAEKRHALELWAQHVRSLVDAIEPKVVPLRPHTPAA